MKVRKSEALIKKTVTALDIFPNLRQFSLTLEDDARVDHLNQGRWIIQRHRGHRATSDDQILAGFLYSYWTQASSPLVLELGSGKGTISLLLSALWTTAHFIGIETQEIAYRLSQKNIRLNQLEKRFTNLLGDLREPLILQQALELASTLRHHHTISSHFGFDLICGAPPFMPLGSGILPIDSQRAAGRFELNGGVEDYLKAVSVCLAPTIHSRAFIIMDGQNHQRTISAIHHYDNLKLIRCTEIKPRPQSSTIYEVFELAYRQKQKEKEKPYQLNHIPLSNSFGASSSYLTHRLHQRNESGDQWSEEYDLLRKQLRLERPSLPWIFIPARLASTRLPQKALIDLHGYPMIYRVVQNLNHLIDLNQVVVVSDDQRVLVASQYGNVDSDTALLNGEDNYDSRVRTLLISDVCHSGSERVFKAFQHYQKIQPGLIQSEWIINVQGDEPLLPLESLVALIEALPYFQQIGIYIATLACPLPTDEKQKRETLKTTSTVKVACATLEGKMSFSPHHPHCISWQKALYFTRQATGTKQHIGVYAFHRDHLNILATSRSELSTLENLEQLAWLEMGYEIGVVTVKEPHPPGVDTLADLELTRKRFEELDM